MTTMASETAVTGGLSAAVSEVAGVVLSSLSEDQLLAMVGAVEQARRRLEALDSGLIAELDERNLAGKYLVRSTGALLAGLVNLSPREAALRVRHARALGPRVTVTGERLAPLLPATATARATGAISGGHVSVIIRTIDKLPTTLPVQQIADAETFLVEQAHQFDPTTLARIAQRLVDTLDPDGTLADEDRQRRHRYLTLTPTGGGMHRLTADLDGETAALATAVLHSLAAPQPADTGTGTNAARVNACTTHSEQSSNSRYAPANSPSPVGCRPPCSSA